MNFRQLYFTKYDLLELTAAAVSLPLLSLLLGFRLICFHCLLKFRTARGLPLPAGFDADARNEYRCPAYATRHISFRHAAADLSNRH